MPPRRQLRSARRWPTPKGPQLRNKGDALPILGQKAIGKPDGTIDTISEATVIDVGSRSR
jgi:hypothetical protein